MNIEYIEWTDSVMRTEGWVSADEIAGTSSACISVGIVIKENDYNIVIAPHMAIHADDSYNNFSGIMVIPKCAITLREFVRRTNYANT